MIKFAADAFFQMSAVLTRFTIIPQSAHTPEQMRELFDCLQDTVKYCRLLGMDLSVNKGITTIDLLNSGRCSPELLHHSLKELHERIYEELGSEWFKYIPSYKSQYIKAGRFEIKEIIEFGWDTQTEFVRAGDCFALGMSTASVFHLMRIVDAGLKSAAKSLGIAYSSESWKTVGDKIQKEMEKKYPDKSVDWKQKEPLYAELLTDIGAIGKAHRNPALHDLRVDYTEDEAQYLLTVVEAFIRHLSLGGLREA
jgi:hypothetical protein